MYVYIRSEPNLWTVGSYDAANKWHPESDHETREGAAQRVAWLNSGGYGMPNQAHYDKLIEYIKQLEAKMLRTQVAHLIVGALLGSGIAWAVMKACGG